jgi:hypothetical protein
MLFFYLLLSIFSFVLGFNDSQINGLKINNMLLMSITPVCSFLYTRKYLKGVENEK